MEFPQTRRNPTSEQWNFQSKSHECAARVGFWLEISLLTSGISECLWKFHKLIVGFIISTTSKSLSKCKCMHKIFKFLLNLSRKQSEISTDISEISWIFFEISTDIGIISWNFLKFSPISVRFLKIFEIFTDIGEISWNFEIPTDIGENFWNFLKFSPTSVRIFEIFWNPTGVLKGGNYSNSKANFQPKQRESL